MTDLNTQSPMTDTERQWMEQARRKAGESMRVRMARAIYAKAEALGIDIDPEGCGDLSRATLLALAGLDAIYELTPWVALRGATVRNADESIDFIWQTILEDIKGGKE